METFFPNFPTKAVAFANGATGSSAALEEHATGTNYWVDQASSWAHGDAFDAFYEAVNTDGVTVDAVLWAQGPQDANGILDATDRANYKLALEEIFSNMRSNLGSIPIIMQLIGHRTGFINTGGYQAVREVQKELISENSFIHFGCETFDQAITGDGVHPDDYLTLAVRMARKAANLNGASLTGVDGPSVASAVRASTAVTVTITHDDGSDFIPTSGIEGFHFFDDGVEIAISAAVRTNATTITLTLASAPTGVETLYYIYDDENPLTIANVVTDDATVTMPLQSTVITL